MPAKLGSCETCASPEKTAIGIVPAAVPSLVHSAEPLAVGPTKKSRPFTSVGWYAEFRYVPVSPISASLVAFPTVPSVRQSDRPSSAAK